MASPSAAPPPDTSWRTAYAVVLGCHFLTFFAFSAAFPFISLYVQQLGVDRASAAGWAGAVNSSSTAVVAVMNPIWGTLADRWGVKAGLVRCLALGALGLAICGLAQSPEHLLVGRMLQSIGGGANAAAIIVVGAIVPASSAGMAMGLMQTGQSVGGSLGPAIGGVMGDTVGFRVAFFASAVVTVLVTAAVWVFVREPSRATRPRQGESFFAGARYVMGQPRLRDMIFLMFIYHAAYQVVWTFVPLRMQNLIAPDQPVGQWSGAALLSDTLGIAIGAALVGWAGGRWPAKWLVVGLCLLALAATALHLVITQPELLVAVRFFVGFSYGGAVPIMRAALGNLAEPARRGVAFGVAQGAFAAGFSLGALTGSQVIGQWGLLGAFAVSTLVFGVTTTWALVRYPRPAAA